nr:PilZ domain-containing protein [uncultured Sphingomonas sp.]
MFMDKGLRGQPEAEEVSGTSGDQPAGFVTRRFERHAVRCPVRVRIGNRQYAAYLDNASQGGVKLSTRCRIIPADKVVVHIPDLPPLRGELRWASEREAGVAFPLVDGLASISEWMERRSGSQSKDGG